MFSAILGFLLGFPVAALIAAYTGDSDIGLVYAVLAVATAIILVGFW